MLVVDIPEHAGPGPKHMWIIIVVNVGILATAIVIAAVCCRRGSSGSTGEGTYYSYLPGMPRVSDKVCLEPFMPHDHTYSMPNT